MEVGGGRWDGWEGRRGKGGWVDLHVYGGVCEAWSGHHWVHRVPQRFASLAVDLYRLNSPAFSRQMGFLMEMAKE